MSENAVHQMKQSENDNDDSNDGINTGLNSLIIIANFFGLSADPEQIKHYFAIHTSEIDSLDMLRVAKKLGLKTKLVQIPLKRINKMRLPAIIKKKIGGYAILAKIENDEMLVFDTQINRAEKVSKEKFQEIWSGDIFLFVKSMDKETESSFGIKWFLRAVLKYKKVLVEVLLASFILQILGLVSPLITQVVIDKVLVHQGITTLDVLAFGLAAMAIFEFVISLARTYIFSHTTSRIDVSLGAKLFAHLFKLPLAYFENRRIGDTVARVRELENIRQFMTGAPLTAVLDVLFIAVYFTVMFIYSKALTFIVLGTFPLFILLSVLVTPVLRHRLEEKFQRGSESQSFLVEAVSGVQTVKALALEPEMQKRWEGLLSNYIRASFKSGVLSGHASAVAQFIQRGLSLFILWFGAHQVMDGMISVGQLIAFQMLSGRVSDPVLRLVNLWKDFQQTGISIKKMGDIFLSKPEPSMNPTKSRLPAMKGEIRFDRITFRYRVDGPETVKNMSFHIPAGSIVGFVGRSGSGKSTLTMLMQRLYLPESGKILVDGIDTSMADPVWLRRQIGVVLQENFLFNGSIRENIAIHLPSANIQDIIRAAQLAGAHEFILELPEGYDTVVGEKGVSLSGGQRQRLAIARALLTNPKILILDEATSALDYESERIIQNNLQLICRGRTVIIIAHRLSTLKHAQKIMVVDKGSLIEAGSHVELMQQKGLYHYLYSQQERD